MYDWVVNCSIHKYHCRKYNIIFVCVAHIAFKIYRLQNCDFCGRNSCHSLFVSARSFEFDICTMCEWCTVTYVVNCIIEEFDYITTVLCVLFVSQSLVYVCAASCHLQSVNWTVSTLYSSSTHIPGGPKTAIFSLLYQCSCSCLINGFSSIYLKEFVAKKIIIQPLCRC